MKISQKGSKASPHCNTQMTVPIQQESLDSMYSFGEDFGSCLKHSHCRHLLFIHVLIKWASSTHICQASTDSEAESAGSSARPACLETVSDPSGEMSGEKKEREERKVYELFIGL